MLISATLAELVLNYSLSSAYYTIIIAYSSFMNAYYGCLISA